MKRYRISGFVMADSILALAVVTLGIITLLTCQQLLTRQQAKHDTKLMAARLAKESSDQLLATGHPAVIERGGYKAVAVPDRITVYRNLRLVVSLRR